MSETWDQSVLDNTIKDYLMEHESTVWPRCLNESAFVVAHEALKETPATEIIRVVSELMRPIVPSGSKSGESVPIGFVIATKRASKHWQGGSSMAKAKAFSRLQQGKSANMLKAWHRETQAALERMVGGRSRALAFIRLGWLFVKHDLKNNTDIRLSVWSGNPAEMAKARGRFKGGARPATSGNLSVTIENMAHAKSETKGGFEALGQPALDRGMQARQASMQKYLEGEMEPGILKFNSAQGR